MTNTKPKFLATLLSLHFCLQVGMHLGTHAFALNHASAKTLVVTHPEKEWDQNSTAAPATKLLLRDSSFSQKIVLTSGEPFTFSTRGLVFEKRFSGQGEINWNFTNENQITLAGGFFTGCFLVTVVDLLKASHLDLNLTFDMSAVFELHPYSETAITLKTRMKDIGTQATKRELKNFAQTVLKRLDANANLAVARQSAKYQFTVTLDDQPVATIGSGAQKIRFNFQSFR